MSHSRYEGRLKHLGYPLCSLRSLAAINPYSLSRFSTGLGIGLLFFIAAKERIEHKKGIEIDG